MRDGAHLLCVASAGDNAFDLALGGARITAVDLSLPQLAACELKLAGGHLAYPQFRALLGIDPHPDRVGLYRRIRDALTAGARAFWDGHTDLIEAGLLGGGRFERYLGLFRTRLLPWIHRRATCRAWFDLPDIDGQRRFYADRWDNRRWRALFRVFFSRRVMAALGRSPEQFAHVDGPIGDVLLQRTRRVLSDLPLRDNGYVQWMLTGTFLHDEALPAYLSEAGHARLGDIAERIELVHAPLEAHLPGVAAGTFDGANLSNVFEYLPVAQTDAILAELARACRAGARLAYWNLFVDRRRPAALADRLQPLDDLAARLFAADRAFVYGAFRVEEVR